MASDILPRDGRASAPLRNDQYEAQYQGDTESRFSGVSWSAIFAGGVGSAAMALVLVTLGVGLGLVAASPWQYEGVSAATLGIGVIIWSIVVHAVSFGLGGYLTGRLRTKWANTHGDEVYFRDSAHGFVTWGLGMLVSFCIMASVAGEFARGTAEVAAAGAGGAGLAGAVLATDQMTETGGTAAGNPAGGPSANPIDYFADQLFRPSGASDATGNTGSSTDPSAPSMPALPSVGAPAAANSAMPAEEGTNNRAEAGRILTASLVNGEISGADRTYLAQLIATQTGMTQQEAEARVDQVMTEAQAAIETARAETMRIADETRKVAIGGAMWAFIAMLIGAFSASLAATYGGRARDA